jgi:hypothetical protein
MAAARAASRPAAGAGHLHGRAIAGHKPVTPAALLEVPGIGALKAERYGRRVLEVVNGDK